MGWAVIDRDEDDYSHVDSGVFHYPQFQKKQMKYQPYRLMLLEQYLTVNTPTLIDKYHPNKVITETVPARGAGEAGGTFLQLALTATDGVHAVCILNGIEFSQIGATTVQTRMLGKGAKKTKPRVRNAVIALYPELVAYKRAWLKEFEQPDAIAIGSVGLGHKV